ncbi:MAG TPA: di-heme oxidoredictase family protein [Burkholderiales bacterium]|jgi:CxxC motif-containing protein (DUF1111 family)|nr:di-heme oxidoredictase family protein [Burkholderiales bacterium]
MAEAPSAAGGSSTIPDATREAFAQPSPALPRQLRESFFLGRSLFRQVWVVAPAMDRDVSGLGPIFNRPSCAACHLKNGRGRAPDHPAEKMSTMLVRLSIPGIDAHGGPLPHPAYGDQLNDSANPGIAAEGQARITWQEHLETLPDGERVSLRRPLVRFSELAYGPLGEDVLVSPRIAPPVFGLGLLEAVPESTLQELAAHSQALGLGGRLNRVWDPSRRAMVVGRFGWKANSASLLTQTAAAFLGDLGITSSLFPDENCTMVQAACSAAPSAGAPELSDARLAVTILYQQSIAVPARRDSGNPKVARGERAFASAGCVGCHVPELLTGGHPLPFLSGQHIHPYTDLLLHDMGEGLADHRPDFLASGRDWRTPPLWGIGLGEHINGHRAFLHDGRARTYAEAILWHDGDAGPSREAFRAMGKADRDALLEFLDSL